MAATVTATPAQVVEVVEEVEDDYEDPLARDAFTREVDEAGSSGAELADNPIEGVAEEEEEEEEEEEDSDDDEVQEPPLPSNYVYTSQWTIFKKRERLSGSNKPQQTSESGSSYFYNYKRWLATWLDKNLTYKVKQEVIALTYPRLRKELTVRKDLDSIKSYSIALAQLRNWCNSSKTDLRLDIEVTVETPLAA